MNRDGTVVGVFGSPGAGKSYFLIHTLLRERIDAGDFVVYSTPKHADARSWPHGPVIRSPGELYGKSPTPRAVCVLQNHAGARELVAQAQTVRPRVTAAFDEAHELWPNAIDSQPGGLDEFHKIRDQQGLTLVWASQWPARFSKGVYRATVDLGGVYWFRLTTPRDVRWVEDEYEAEAALQVAELEARRWIHVRGAELPKGWDGYKERLRRKAARLR